MKRVKRSNFSATISFAASSNLTFQQDRDLEHVEIVGPAIEALQTIFDDALRKLPEQ